MERVRKGRFCSFVTLTPLDFVLTTSELPSANGSLMLSNHACVIPELGSEDMSDKSFKSYYLWKHVSNSIQKVDYEYIFSGFPQNG